MDLLAREERSPGMAHRYGVYRRKEKEHSSIAKRVFLAADIASFAWRCQHLDRMPSLSIWMDPSRSFFSLTASESDSWLVGLIEPFHLLT